MTTAATPSRSRDVRAAARQGTLTGVTAGLAPGFVQGNLVVVPAACADDFRLFCERNPKPCPLIGVTARGSALLPALGADVDLRTDLPRYRVWRDGVVEKEVNDITALWRDDLVGFVLGCSFSFEEALVERGVPVRHLERGTNVPMYRTTIQCEPAGCFSGPLVVSMRPFSPADAIRAIEITARYPSVHGAPVHVGEPWRIGIEDLSKPHYGEPVDVADDELPLFWACGVTPQVAIAAAGVRFAITHAPGCMLVTDLLNTELAIG